MDGSMNARSLPKIGTIVKTLRRRRGLTQAELAAQSGVSRQWLIGLEAGPPPGTELGRVLHVLDTLDASLWVRDDQDTP